uniref:U-reduvitoxin-Pr6a n=1 Tax=Platymeris rhadamanthus TaxID=1134088 RepID=PLK6A_PLARH|nr:RecName: Full=U-reduvitoxin-Pr6a; Short=U-RDTX-Pr6a; Flags: Precursor [Platymeris rhadamanthus]QHB21539.1 venom Ptu1 family peptide Pr6a [Platymeris rhadamanthus]
MKVFLLTILLCFLIAYCAGTNIFDPDNNPMCIPQGEKCVMRDFGCCLPYQCDWMKNRCK